MLRAVPMRRFGLVVHERDQRAVLQSLGESGSVQFVQTPPGPATAPLPPRGHSEELARCSRVLTRVDALRRALEIPPSDPANALEPASWDQAEETLGRIERQCEALLQRRERLLGRLRQTTADWERLSRYREVSFPLGARGEGALLHLVAGTVPARNLSALEGELGGNTLVASLPAVDGSQPLVAAVSRRGWPALKAALDRAGFEEENLPVMHDTPPGVLCRSREQEREKLLAAVEEGNRELAALGCESAVALGGIELLAQVERGYLDAEGRFPRTEVAVYMQGWVPGTDADGLEARVAASAPGRSVVSVHASNPGSEDEPPVLLRQPRWLRPFGMLVEAYGLPNYRELEPTLFVALSYVLMFGMMFGDAGHGAILATGGLLALLRGRTGKMRDAGVLLLYAGLSSVLFGITYGSYFGIQGLRGAALWHDPLEGNPMGLLGAGVMIGIVMISLGLVLNILNRVRRGDIIGALLDKFGALGLLFYWGSLGLLWKSAALRAHGLTGLAMVLVFLLPLAGWSLKEPLEYWACRHRGQPAGEDGGLFGAAMESAVGAFEAVLSYLANTISFVRLGAYAMSHAALLAAAFVLAEQLRHVPTAGGVLSVLMVILGNAVAIVLEGIIASVQALRLEYYEFFGKFFSGNGRAFEPFRLTPGVP